MQISPELFTFLHSMIPIGELRTAIPVATGYFGLPSEIAYIWAVLGNMVPALILLKLMNPIASFARKYIGPLDRFLTKLFDHTRKKHSKKFERYEALFLPIFVAIPLPGSGVYTGILISFVFGIPYWKSLGLIGIGVLISGALVTIGFDSLFALLDKLS
ncbi:MAG: small multi-drug export protein [Patescibacteria group bacterium]|nr:small multi-drug export protein [Patescibacteria group bacterium]